MAVAVTVTVVIVTAAAPIDDAPLYSSWRRVARMAIARYLRGNQISCGHVVVAAISTLFATHRALTPSPTSVHGGRPVASRGHWSGRSTPSGGHAPRVGAYVSVVGAYEGASVTRDGAYVSERVGAAVTVGVIVLVVGAIVGAS